MNSRVFLYDDESGSFTIKEPDPPPAVSTRSPLFGGELPSQSGTAGPVAVIIGVLGISLLAVPAGGSWIYRLAGASAVALGATLAAIVRRHRAHGGGESRLSLPWVHVLRDAVRSINARKTIRDAMLARMLDILVPLTAIGLLYSATQIWLDSGVFREGSTRTLLWLEQTAIWLKSEYPLTKFILKVPKGYEFGFVILFCLLGSCVPLLARLDLIGQWKKTARWLGRAYIVLTLVSSITFFGNQQLQTIQATAARLNAQADRVRSDYGEVQQEAERIVSRIAVEQLASNRFAQPVADLRDIDRSVARAEDRAQPARRLGIRIELPSSRLRDSVYGTQDFRGRDQEAGATGSPHAETRLEYSANPRWSAQQDGSIRAEAEKAAGAEKSAADRMHPIIDSAADYVHGAVFKQVATPIFAAAGIHGEFLQLLLEPFLKTPGKELLKRQARNLFDRVANRGEKWANAIAAVRESMRAEVTGFHTDSAQESATESVAAGILAAKAEAADLEHAAPAEVRRQLQEEYATELAAFDRAAAALLGENPDAIIRAAADRVVSAIHIRLSGISEPLDRIASLRAIAAYAPGSGPNLRALAALDNAFGSSIVATVLESRVPAILSADAGSEWGGIREEMYRRVSQDNNHIGEAGRAAAKETVSAWIKARREIATEIAWESPSNSREALEGLWERRFFEYSESHPDMAGLWGFMLIAERDISPRLTDHTIPEDGFVWYCERTSLADRQRVREIFSTSAAIRLINAVCPAKPADESSSLPDLVRRRGTLFGDDGQIRRPFGSDADPFHSGFDRVPTPESERLFRRSPREPVRRPIEIRPVP